jgi:hypothetical protein
MGNLKESNLPPGEGDPATAKTGCADERGADPEDDAVGARSDSSQDAPAQPPRVPEKNPSFADRDSWIAFVAQASLSMS